MKIFTSYTGMLVAWLAFVPLHASNASAVDRRPTEGYLKVAIHPLIKEAPGTPEMNGGYDDVGEGSMDQPIKEYELLVWSTNIIMEVLTAIGENDKNEQTVFFTVERKDGRKMQDENAFAKQEISLSKLFGDDNTNDVFWTYTPQWHLPKWMGGCDYVDKAGKYHPVHSHAYGLFGVVVGLLAFGWGVGQMRGKPAPADREKESMAEAEEAAA